MNYIDMIIIFSVNFILAFVVIYFLYRNFIAEFKNETKKLYIDIHNKDIIIKEQKHAIDSLCEIGGLSVEQTWWYELKGEVK